MFSCDFCKIFFIEHHQWLLLNHASADDNLHMISRFIQRFEKICLVSPFFMFSSFTSLCRTCSIHLFLYCIIFCNTSFTFSISISNSFKICFSFFVDLFPGYFLSKLFYFSLKFSLSSISIRGFTFHSFICWLFIFFVFVLIALLITYNLSAISEIISVFGYI